MTNFHCEAEYPAAAITARISSIDLRSPFAAAGSAGHDLGLLLRVAGKAERPGDGAVDHVVRRTRGRWRVMVSTTSLTFFCCAIGSSWSACGASPLNAWPPCEARQMFSVWAPEQAMLIFSFTDIAALLIGATSARWQPLPYELP